MKYRLVISSVLLSLLSSTSWGASSAESWCYEKGIIYPNGMFGQFSNKRQKSSHEISRIFQFGKDTLSQRPGDMLYGLAYLEIMVNELCMDRNNPEAIKSRKKIQGIVDDLRQSLGLSMSMSRQKMVNIYWSTGRLLSLANIQKLEVDEKQKEKIIVIKEAKAALKAALKEFKKNEK
jgi:Mg2+/Co2+ transporter CorB